MNNDYKAFQANHSSMSSNKPIANKTQFNYNKAISQRNKYLNKDSNNNNNSPYKKNNKFTRGIKYPYNKGPLNSPYEDEIITGYYVNSRDEPRMRSENGGEEENEEENNEESDYEENKSYDQLLNDYTNLKKKYDELMKNRNDNNTNNNNSKLSYKKINPELASLPGETTFGSIKTDTHKLYKFKASFQNNNNSTSNIKDNLTISNYNDEDNNERHYYTPDHYYDEDSFNDNKDKRYSYSSIHSDEYSKYFDNEQPKHKFKSFNTKKTKGITLDKTKKK